MNIRESSLDCLLKTSDCNLFVGASGLIIQAPTRTVAREIAVHPATAKAADIWNHVTVRCSELRSPYVVTAITDSLGKNPTTVNPIGENPMSLTTPSTPQPMSEQDLEVALTYNRFFQPIFDLLTEPGKAGGLTEIIPTDKGWDGRIACMNATSSQFMMGGHTPKTALNYKRSDYIWRPDLEAMNSELQLLTPNDPNSSVVLSYISFDPKKGVNNSDPQAGEVRRYTHRYWLYQSPNGTLYSRNENLEVEDVLSPPWSTSQNSL